jgi:hypothetical protein
MRIGRSQELAEPFFHSLLGIFVMGAAVGALVTFIAHSGKIQSLRAEIEKLQTQIHECASHQQDSDDAA